MKLLAGQRFLLEDTEAFIKVVSGQAEAYAVTAGDVSYRQFYLLDVAEGQAAFPAMDGFGEIKVLLYAVEDS